MEWPTRRLREKVGVVRCVSGAEGRRKGMLGRSGREKNKLIKNGLTNIEDNLMMIRGEEI